jgi:phosphate transport system substrate-binding protein
MAEDLDYVPMPKNIVTEIRRSGRTEIKDASGKPIYAISN